LESFPPLYLIAIRYVISGSILLLFATLSGIALPRGRELLMTAICGAICIGIGNGFLAIAEKSVPSGLAALFISTSPFWMIGIDALLPGGKRPRTATMGGLLVGLSGVAFLIFPIAIHEGLGGVVISGFLLLQISAAGWVLGSLLQKRVETRSKLFVIGAVQQCAAGVSLLIPASIFEKMPHVISLRSGLAVAYLVVFGSLIGFSAFVYSVAKLPVAVASIYAFVNPIVAVWLGFLFFREPFGGREAIAMLIIFVGIALVRWSESLRSQSPAAVAMVERASSG
jgi:drug/metabolite transporter (DMT)-like permease